MVTCYWTTSGSTIYYSNTDSKFGDKENKTAKWYAQTKAAFTKFVASLVVPFEPEQMRIRARALNSP